MLTTCYPHNITYDDDRYEDGCPACSGEQEAAKYKKQVDNWENKEIECFEDGKREMASVIKNELEHGAGYLIIEEVKKIVEKTLKGE